MDRPLARLLLARLSGVVGDDAASLDELERVLVTARETARAVWPAWVSEETFIAYVVDRALRGRVDARGAASAESTSVIAHTVAGLRIADLYLACACASGNPDAIAAFDDQCFATLDRALGGFSMSPAALDEAKQVLRTKLLVAGPDRPPQITEYTGRGELRAWVRASALRTAWRTLRRPKGETFVDSHVMRAVAVAGDDLELDYLKRRYTHEFEQALRDAFASLPVRDRNVSRYYYGTGLGIDDIGAVYHVHRSTAARWVNRATASLIAATRRMLMSRLGASRSEVSSLVRMLESRIDATLRAVAASDGTPQAL